MADPRYSLVSLLSSTSYRLAYALPLLLLSVLVTFTGTFFTLDRSRSFPPRYDVLSGPKTKSVRYLLEGGIGGLAAGYLFGLHFSTFLSLLIPSLSSTSAPLSPAAFLAVWILSSALCCVLGGRYRLTAIGFSGLTGGTTLPLALCVILHPALSTRTIVVAVFLPIIFLLSILPIARTQRPALRLANASTGAFGLVLSISILANIPAWANVWDRLWVKDSIEWGTSKERYLAAAYCLFLAFGTVSDWLLRSKFGECPDEKWDSYLASYTNHLPNQADRAGTFQPAQPAWDRFFHPKPKATELLFPETGRPTGLGYQTLDVDLDLKLPPPAPGFLKKNKTKSRGFRKSSGGSNSGRKPIKFKPLDPNLSDDSSDEALDVKRPFAHKSASSSTAPTLVGAEQKPPSLAPPRKLRDDQPEYSDYEEDLTTQHKRDGDPSEQGKWKPAFIRKHTASTAQTRSHTTSTVATIPIAPPGAIPVPATPSLIKALDRIAVAQKDAFSHTDARLSAHKEESRISKHDGLPRVHDSPLSDDESDADPEAGNLPGKGKQPDGRHWDEFWRDVKDKARS
ncbi:hypothetical protein BDN72DRAFT_888245 [Pluteus cervinus]|uniref:Uncharacterized protein n=1 Tax=Pluteus cervinus TaxID=181527 RepID=A0ACD3AUU1_9AGAR|nr:hypothetical protein BDN72DRAFT_888245 [Pluteus cervinus]